MCGGLTRKKLVSFDIDVWQRFCHHKRLKRLMDIRYDMIWSSLYASLPLISFKYTSTHTTKTFFLSFYAVAAQNFCLTRCGYTRLSENRVCEQKTNQNARNSTSVK